MATIKDIASKTGYSIGTVSRVINNKSDVSEEARTRIEEAIKELDFHPNRNAKMLKQVAPSGIAIIVRGIGNRFLNSIFEKIQTDLLENGENISVRFISETDNEVETAMRSVRHSRPKGFIFLGGSLDDFTDYFQEIPVPGVVVTCDVSTLNIDSLSSYSTDDYTAARAAINTLITAGHRNIGVIGGYPTANLSDNLQRRLKGAKDELEANDLVFETNFNYIPCPFSYEAGYEAANRLLDNCPETTAVFALSDTVGISVMRAAADRGMKIPEDLSVLGFDGIDICNYSIPRLSSMKQDAAHLAKMAVDDILIRVNYQRPAVHETVPYTFVEGESIAPPRAIK
ncbi:MAG: LacI family DNA-binding transcriptional regulator [Oscillospiraceae bacterium]|nr:LacI family DNA-binding transcriptional regulator [Oscillospiraceae bacterium]